MIFTYYEHISPDAYIVTLSCHPTQRVPDTLSPSYYSTKHFMDF